MENNNTEAILDWDGLFKSLQLTALNQKNVTEQMGILTSGFKELKSDNLLMRSEIDRTNERIDTLEKEQFVRPYQQAQYDPAIKSRVSDLLKDIGYIDDKEMWRSFMRKCWYDCKSKSVMVGTRGVYTEKANHERVLDYIGRWTPEGFGGAIGYANHLLHKGDDK